MKVIPILGVFALVGCIDENILRRTEYYDDLTLQVWRKYRESNYVRGDSSFGAYIDSLIIADPYLQSLRYYDKIRSYSNADTIFSKRSIYALRYVRNFIHGSEEVEPRCTQQRIYDLYVDTITGQHYERIEYTISAGGMQEMYFVWIK